MAPCSRRQLGQLGERRTVAVHRKQRIGDDQPAAKCYRLENSRSSQIGYIAVADRHESTARRAGSRR